MKRILILIVAAITLVGVDFASAQSRNSYFMEGSYFRNELNPALAPTRGFINLPLMSGVGMNVTTNFLSVDNFLYQREGQVVTALHNTVSADEFLGKLPAQNKLSADMKTNLFSLGFYSKKSFWTFGVDANVDADLALSSDIFKALKTLGNGSYDLGSTALSANAYLDVFLGTSFRVHKNVNLGIKFKFLVGIANVGADFTQLSADVTPESVVGQLRGTWRANAVFIDKREFKKGEEISMDAFKMTDLSYVLQDMKSFGAAIDLGTEVRLLDDHLKISAAITDLGFIKWSEASHIAGAAEADFYYEGFDFETQEVKMDGDFTLPVYDPSDNKGYSSMLNFSVNAGVEYNFLNNHIAIGLLSHTKFCNTLTYSELTASVNFRPTNWLSATVSHTFLNYNKFGVLGFALNIHPRVINIYAGVDFIDTSWVKGPKFDTMQPSLPRYQKSLNAYVGVGFNFGRPSFLKHEKKVKDK